MATVTPLITVCVCTFKRTGPLERLLSGLERQVTQGQFTYSIVVADNDELQSARPIVESWSKRSTVPIVYVVEPHQSIALARNASVRMADGEFVAFIDDDEYPAHDWLCNLHQTLLKFGSSGVMGPVFPVFASTAPKWALKGQVFRRKAFATGEVIPWTAAAIGNALVKRDVLLELDGPFRSQFGAGGEDRDFFRRAVKRGHRFVWCADAVCHEPVAPERTRISFQLRRALLRGKVAMNGPGGSWLGIVKSAFAVPAYWAVLPMCLALGSHVFVTVLVKSFDHLGKLLAACGIDAVGDKYIT
jgi:succinoglycan biosynthesis protein ExoM